MADAVTVDEAAVRRIVAATNAGMADVAEYVADEWRRLAPVGDPATDPHAGRLRDSITVTRTDDGAHVSSDAPEWLFNEFGTVNMAPQPSALPAFVHGMARWGEIVGARARRELGQ